MAVRIDDDALHSRASAQEELESLLLLLVGKAGGLVTARKELLGPRIEKDASLRQPVNLERAIRQRPCLPEHFDRLGLLALPEAFPEEIAHPELHLGEGRMPRKRPHERAADGRTGLGHHDTPLQPRAALRDFEHALVALAR